MRILIINRSFPCHRTGGMEWHADDLVTGLNRRGHEVHIVTTKIPKQIALKPLETNGRIFEFGNTPGSYSFSFLKELTQKAKTLVETINPDVIHAQGYAGIITRYALGSEAPLLTTIHGTLWSETPLFERHFHSFSELWRWKHRYIFSPVWKVFLRSRPHLVADSNFTVKALRREGLRGALPKVVPLGFDLSRFPMMDLKDAKSESKVDQERLHLLCLSRIEQVKRIDWVVRAVLGVAKRCGKHCTLTIAGEGAELSHLKRQFHSSKHCDLRFAGKVGSSEVPALLGSADLFINLDHGHPAFGLSNAEALVMGTPVLVTNSGAHREVVSTKDPHSRIVPRNDLTQIQRSLEEVLENLPEDERLRSRRATWARKRFAIDRMLADYETIYDVL